MQSSSHYGLGIVFLDRGVSRIISMRYRYYSTYSIYSIYSTYSIYYQFILCGGVWLDCGADRSVWCV